MLSQGFAMTFQQWSLIADCSMISFDDSPRIFKDSWPQLAPRWDKSHLTLYGPRFGNLWDHQTLEVLQLYNIFGMILLIT